MQDAKVWYKSRTLWFNFLVAIATVFWPVLQQYLTPEQAGAVVVIGNVLLRLVTNSPVKAA